jgi:hypothetical protein
MDGAGPPARAWITRTLWPTFRPAYLRSVALAEPFHDFRVFYPTSWPLEFAGQIVMPSVIGLSFCCMIVGAAVALEWADISNAGFAFAALAAVIFFSAMDAWETEEARKDEAGPSSRSGRGRDGA